MDERRNQFKKVLKDSGVPARTVDRCKDEDLEALLRQGYDHAEALESASRDSLKEVLPGSLALVDAILAAKGVCVCVHANHCMPISWLGWARLARLQPRWTPSSPCMA